MSKSTFFERRLQKELKKKKEAEDKALAESKIKAEAMSSDELQVMLDEVFTPEPEKVVEETKIPTIEQAQAIVEKAIQAEMAELKGATHYAHNVYYNNANKKFMLVTIEYNLVNNSCRIIGEKPFSDDVAVATSKVSDIFALKLFRREENL